MTALVSKKIFAFLNVCTIHGQNILDVHFYSVEISKWLPLSNMATAVVSLIITWITQICRLRQFNGFEHSEYTVNNYVFLENRFIILENKMAASCPRWLLTVVTNKVLHAIVYGLWCSWCHCCALIYRKFLIDKYSNIQKSLKNILKWLSISTMAAKVVSIFIECLAISMMAAMAMSLRLRHLLAVMNGFLKVVVSYVAVAYFNSNSTESSECTSTEYSQPDSNTCTCFGYYLRQTRGLRDR